MAKAEISLRILNRFESPVALMSSDPERLLLAGSLVSTIATTTSDGRGSAPLRLRPNDIGLLRWLLARGRDAGDFEGVARGILAALPPQQAGTPGGAAPASGADEAGNAGEERESSVSPALLGRLVATLGQRTAALRRGEEALERQRATLRGRALGQQKAAAAAASAALGEQAAALRNGEAALTRQRATLDGRENALLRGSAAAGQRTTALDAREAEAAAAGQELVRQRTALWKVDKALTSRGDSLDAAEAHLELVKAEVDRRRDFTGRTLFAGAGVRVGVGDEEVFDDRLDGVGGVRDRLMIIIFGLLFWARSQL